MGKIWQHEAGKTLMKAIGFGDPFEMMKDNGTIKAVVMLRGLPTQNVSSLAILPAQTVANLKSRRQEIKQELEEMTGGFKLVYFIDFDDYYGLIDN